jgi:histidinol-phosphatase (PHP family)
VTQVSYHNHTTWSDGKSSIAEMVEAGRKAGLKEIGVSDHFALAEGNPNFRWALPTNSLDRYISEVRAAAASTKGIHVRLGLEVDYFPETVHQVREQLSSFEFDYLIGSVHFVKEFAIDLNSKPWEGISQEERNNVWRSYWRLLGEAAQSGIFDVLGHFDLPKKYKFHPTIDLSAEACEVLDAVAAADMAIEINTSGWDKPVGEAYPSLRYLREANRRKIPLLISADAHSAAEITRHFNRARELAAEAGYTELVRFERRQRSTYSL